MDEQQRINVVSSSSNSSSMVSSKTYDVFLSFRGEDTRRNFTSHLYKALNEKKVKTYMDDQLEKGDEISPALTKAIEDSHISIVIFSENYASSKWCLGELTKILECKKENGQILIPVFYNIDPSHVRKQTGNYEQAFAKHEGEPNCNKWKAALTAAANLAGWDSRNRTETDFLKDIVEDTLQKLAPRYPQQRKGLVGIEENYEQIESLLEIGSSKVKIIGIWGMGGVGKTSLAMALYDKLSYEFAGRCFLTNVGEKSNKLEALQDELYSKLLENKNHGFDHFDMSRLRCKRVFVVLDDVGTSEQLDKLIVEDDFLGPGSRVIVTTRNKQIFRLDNEVYLVQELSHRHSFELFCLTAFGEKQPKVGYEHLSSKVISYCKGIPLALKVMGASLRNKSKAVWKCELSKLRKIPKMEIHNVLKLSYDGLDHSQKDIFLDIACFFKGEKRDWVTTLMESFGFFPASGIEVLLDKALITISDDNEIEMHDLIQEMGWEIVHQESIKDPGRRSRLWKHEEVHDVFKYNMGTEFVEGIILYLHELTGDLCLSSDFLAKMTNVRFLQIHGWLSNRFNVYFPDGLESLSDKLRYLEWDGFCLEYLPSNFCAEQLVELRMPNSKLKKLWDGVQNLVNLKTIDLYNSRDLIQIPDLSKAEKLERVYLFGCESLLQLQIHSKSLKLLRLDCSSLKELSVASEKMTNLNLSGCTKIESLNVHSKSLIDLYLHGCSSLKEISVTSEKMKELNLYGTSICALSSSICHLLSLEELKLRGTNVESLPANVKDLSMLTMLALDNCRKLVSLPELPPFLRELYLNGCWKLVSLSKFPPSLRELYLNDCSKLKSMPELPPSLRELYLNDCSKLESMPELPLSLEMVSARNCISLETKISQRLVLQHMLQSPIPYLHQQYINNYFIFPGDHVTEECGFHTTDSSITIPYLPKSDLCGFIYCIILSKGPSESAWASCSIYEDGIRISWDHRVTNCTNLISDHMSCWYHDIRKLDRINEVNDHLRNITFIFKFKLQKERIKGCGVFPVYASDIEVDGRKFLNGDPLSKSLITSRSPSIGVGVGSSTMTGNNFFRNQEEEDLPINDSLPAILAFLSKHVWRLLMGMSSCLLGE